MTDDQQNIQNDAPNQGAQGVFFGSINFEHQTRQRYIAEDYNEEPQIVTKPKTSPDPDDLAKRHRNKALQNRLESEDPELFRNNRQAIQLLIDQRNDLLAETVQLKEELKELAQEMRDTRDENITIIARKASEKHRNFQESFLSLIMVIIMSAGVNLLTSNTQQLLGMSLVGISLSVQLFFLYQRFRERSE